jgi:hypothetical protein
MFSVDKGFPKVGIIVGPNFANLVGAVIGVIITTLIIGNMGSIIWVMSFVLVVVTVMNTLAYHFANLMVRKDQKKE